MHKITSGVCQTWLQEKVLQPSSWTTYGLAHPHKLCHNISALWLLQQLVTLHLAEVLGERAKREVNNLYYVGARISAILGWKQLYNPLSVQTILIPKTYWNHPTRFTWSYICQGELGTRLPHASPGVAREWTMSRSQKDTAVGIIGK